MLHTHLRVGASLVAEKGFVFTQALLQRLAETECTGLAGVPSHFQILLRRSSFCRMSLPSLRYLQQAGGHLAPVFVRELRAAFPKTEMFIMYGQTEATARLSYLSPEKADRKPGSVGSAIPGVTLHIVDSEGRALPPGEVGEIVAEGPNICQGYWEAEEETRTYFRQGKLHTGDLGTFDAEGDITILDRAKSILKCGGKRISCRQIEETLLEFDEIAEAAVIGMPDETLGEAVKAFVAPRNWRAEGLEERLLAFCRSHLASVFVPREIVCLRELPKSNTGKILKEELKKLPAPSPSCAVAASSA